MDYCGDTVVGHHLREQPDVGGITLNDRNVGVHEFAHDVERVWLGVHEVVDHDHVVARFD